MKIALLILLSLSFSSRAFAKEYQIKDKELGEFRLKIEAAEVKETWPAPQEMDPNPLRLSISVLCKDLRKSKSSLKPQLDVILKDQHICSINKYKMDDDSKVLEVQYSLAGGDDEITCGQDMKQSYDLKVLCESWK